MTAHFPLLDWSPTARNSDPDTSHSAAQEHLNIRAHDKRIVLLTHAAHLTTGLTDFELASMLRRQQTSVGKRRCELRDMGYIADSGKRRPAPSGSSAIVWIITAAGLAMARAAA